MRGFVKEENYEDLIDLLTKLKKDELNCCMIIIHGGPNSGKSTLIKIMKKLAKSVNHLPSDFYRHPSHIHSCYEDLDSSINIFGELDDHRDSCEKIMRRYTRIWKKFKSGYEVRIPILSKKSKILERFGTGILTSYNNEEIKGSSFHIKDEEIVHIHLYNEYKYDNTGKIEKSILEEVSKLIV